MPKALYSEKKPILLWLDSIDQDTLAQAKNLANFPFTFHHIALMPDAHVGYGMPIGGVAATEKVVIPNAVGVDIGCGVCAVQTSLTYLAKADLKKILQGIRQTIPLGFQHHKKPQPEQQMPEVPDNFEKDLPIVAREFASGLLQLGTLGGGNHFIEIQQDDREFLWIMIHSGSRNIGYQVANHYNKLAVEQNKNAAIPIPNAWQLNYLQLDSLLGHRYLQEMQYCVGFAAANRRAMMATVQALIAEMQPSTTFAEAIDVAHNYAALETHFGREVVVHRKGATKAGSGDTGLIPGSQGSTSYVVRGLGNKDSFGSCSHGAGRKLGRKQAQRELHLQTEIERLEAQGILHALRHKRDLEEAAGAYKDITEVIGNQRDLVEVVTTLRPLAVVKG